MSETTTREITDSKVPIELAEGELDTEVLRAIGKRTLPERVLAPAIQNDFKLRIEDVIKKELLDVDMKGLIKKFRPPSNLCVE